MAEVLLISPNDHIISTLQTIFAATSHFTSPAAALAHLEESSEPTASHFLILLDVSSCPDPAACCRNMIARMPVETTRLLAIVAQPAQRSMVLQAGADSCLLAPLDPVELRSEIGAYLQACLPSLWQVLPDFDLDHPKPDNPLQQLLAGLAVLHGADAAWLLLNAPGSGRPRLVVSHPLVDPRQLQIDGWLAWLESQEPLEFHLLDCQAGSGSNPFGPAAPRYHGVVPVTSQGEPLGRLILGWAAPPSLSPGDRRHLARLGSQLGQLTAGHHIYHEAQLNAIQTAFMLLIARVVGGQLDQTQVLSQTLEHTLQLVNATGGEIWLAPAASEAGSEDLVLACASAYPLAQVDARRCHLGQGLVGRAAASGQVILRNDPFNDPHFVRMVDQPQAGQTGALLAAPLIHLKHCLGVLALHSRPGVAFTSRDSSLVENVAGLAAAAVANAQLMKELRDYANQRSVLQAMSEQMANTLDLQTSLERGLQWISRLYDVEYYTIWLWDPAEAALHLAAAIGLPLDDPNFATLPSGSPLVKVVKTRRGLVLQPEDLAELLRESDAAQALPTWPDSVLAAPMIYQNEVIGVVCLANKIGGRFAAAELSLLSTVSEMLSVAVGNARLYSQTVALLAERERFFKQALQVERMAIIGRMTASLSHDINNPMQSIRGALMLSMEELNDIPPNRMTDEIRSYLKLGLSESERVVQLIGQLREIYRPQAGELEVVDLNHLLNGLVRLSGREITRQNIQLDLALQPDLPVFKGIQDQLHLMFLSEFFHVGDWLGARGGGRLRLSTSQAGERVQVEFCAIATGTAALNTGRLYERPQGNASFSLTEDILAAHGGELQTQAQGRSILVRIQLPLSPVLLET